MQIDNRKVKNILVVRNDRFGEFLLNIPALRALRETFRNAKIIAVIDPYVRGLAESISFIDKIIEWKRARHTFIEKIRLLKALKKMNIDIAIMLNPSKEFNLLAYLAGIPLRIGYNRKWGFLLNRTIEDEKYLGEKQEIDYNLELVGLAGARTDDKSLFFEIKGDVPEDFGIVTQENLIALHPWTSDPVKQWPIDNFLKLTRELLKNPDITLAIIGGEGEALKSEEFFGNLHDERLINLTGKTTLKQLALLLRKCKLLISGDSGPVHLACCVGTPVIALFRSDLPEKSAKRWGPWGNSRIVIEKNNLQDISVEEVLQEANKWIM